MKIITGGQTGVDRGALDAAMKLDIDCGGWCPQGRLAENGVIPGHYPLTELLGADYQQRTRQNVLHSYGTLIVYFSVIKGGTEQTLTCCNEYRKPVLLVDADRITISNASDRVNCFIKQHNIQS